MADNQFTRTVIDPVPTAGLGTPARKSPTPLIIALVTLILGVGGLAFYFYNNSRGKDTTIASQAKTIKELEAEVKDLDNRIQKVQADLDSKDLDNKEKAKLVERLRAELRGKDAQLAKLFAAGKASIAEKEALQGRVNTLEHYIDKYQKQIAALQDTISRLKSEKDQLNRNISERDAIAESLKTEKDKLGQRLSSAGALRGAEFEITGIDKNGRTIVPERKNDQVEFRNPGKIRRINACLKLLGNSESREGPRKIFVAIQSSTGTLSSIEAGSGYTALGDRQIQFSTSTVANFRGSALRTCMTYIPQMEGEFQKGQTYQVVFYCGDNGGYELGRTSFYCR